MLSYNIKYSCKIKQELIVCVCHPLSTPASMEVSVASMDRLLSWTWERHCLCQILVWNLWIRKKLIVLILSNWFILADAKSHHLGLLILKPEFLNCKSLLFELGDCLFFCHCLLCTLFLFLCFTDLFIHLFVHFFWARVSLCSPSM